MPVTHEQYIHKVASIAIARLAPEDRKAFEHIKLCYGAGQTGLRGITYYDRWGKADQKAPFVEVCAIGQESIVQLAGTTIHELGHVLAGWSVAHGKEWKDACAKLGLEGIKAAGTEYAWDMFTTDIRSKVQKLKAPDDGQPVANLVGGFIGKGKSRQPVGLKPCTQGIGTRGGKSRGVGSGSRLRKFVCDCLSPIIVRAGRDELDVTCNCCSGLFHQPD